MTSATPMKTVCSLLMMGAPIMRVNGPASPLNLEPDAVLFQRHERRGFRRHEREVRANSRITLDPATPFNGVSDISGVTDRFDRVRLAQDASLASSTARQIWKGFQARPGSDILASGTGGRQSSLLGPQTSRIAMMLRPSPRSAAAFPGIHPPPLLANISGKRSNCHSRFLYLARHGRRRRVRPEPASRRRFPYRSCRGWRSHTDSGPLPATTNLPSRAANTD